MAGGAVAVRNGVGCPPATAVRWLIIVVCFGVAVRPSDVEAASPREALLKMTYLNETEDIHAAVDRYRDRLVKEELKIIVESEQAFVKHYELPMDVFHGKAIANPSGLDASVTGRVDFGPGVVRNAVNVNGRDSHVRVAGSEHRSECLGDLDLCPLGYTVSFWLKFNHPIEDGEYVYLSNGGHDQRSHGIAMLYNRGNLEFRLRKKNGQEWKARSNNVLPGRWYHIVATWGPTLGLMLYVNGDLVESNDRPVDGVPLVGNRTVFNEFYIGRPNDNSFVGERRPISVDEFNFWSEFKSPNDVKELGPMYRYYLPMDARPGLNIEDGNMRVVVGGNPSLVKGKMSGALEFDGRNDFITGDDLTNTCLGDLTLCHYGVTVGAWIRFSELHDSYILTTGNRGVKLYLRGGRLVAEAQRGNQHWQAVWSSPDAGKWYYIELAWNQRDGLGLFADLKEVARATSSRTREPEQGTSHFNIGKSGSNQGNERYASMVMDNLEMWYGNRNELINLDFIARGEPPKQFLGLDAMQYNRIVHPSLTADTYGQPKIVSGKMGGALNLDGHSQYLSLGNHHESCLGNLDLCRHGFLLSAWLKPGQLREGMDILSSGANGIRAWYSGGQLWVSARTLTREWNLKTDKIVGDQWQFVEFGWDPVEGLSLYINDRLVADDSNPTVRSTSDSSGVQPDHEKFYIGRGDGSRSNTRYGNFTVDDFEYWYNNRKYLLAFDYIQRGLPEKYRFDMDAIRDNKLVHPSLSIPVHGNPTIVPGKVNGAIRLDGNRQYLDVGDHTRTCLGNTEFCTHGLTGSMWINFRSLQENSYYLSSGGGLRVFYSGGKLQVVLDRSGKRWEVSVPDVKIDSWYFLEYTWHPEKGLQVYINNKLMGETKQGTTTAETSASGRFLIGSANPSDVPGGRFRYADAIIDEVETWHQDRESLVAFNHLLRDNITHVEFPMESQRGNRITHPDYTIIMHNGALLVPGKVGYGVELGGNGQYVSFGDQQHQCMGNLEQCFRGLTISMFLNPKTLPQNGYILSSGPYSIYSKDGKVIVKFTSGTKTWQVETNKIDLNRWQKLEVSWDEKKGLQLYVDKEKVASTTNYSVLPNPPRITDYTIYLGRPNADQTDGVYANTKIDELEFWYANRDLLQFNDEVNRLIIDMNEIKEETVIHPSQRIFIYGGGRIFSGINGYGIFLNGRNQYIDIGGREVICGGDLDNCQKGFTLRFKIAPNQLIENMYFVSSAPVDVYYQNNRLVAEVRTPRYVWRASTSNIHPNAWHQVDLSWHPVDGLQMFVNSERVDQQTTPSRNYAEYIIDKRFYIGRANTDMRREYYADAIFDDLQLWEAKRDYLISIGLIHPDVDGVAGWTTARTTTRTVPTRRPHPPVTIPSNLPGYLKRLVFDGYGWVSYNFDHLPADYQRRSNQERLIVKFQTGHPDGLLWYTGDEESNIHLTLKGGFLTLISVKDGGIKRETVRITSKPLDDNEWHNVELIRDGQQLYIVVDGQEHPHRLHFDSRLVRPNIVYLGGSERTNEITNSHISTNFYGKIREAKLLGDSLPGELDLKGLSLIYPSHVLVRVSGNVISEDDVVDVRPTPPRRGKQPITFVTKHSHLKLPGWSAAQSGTLEFNFRTVEPNGLILFNGGNRGSKDFVAVELYDAILFLVLNMGDGVHRFPISYPSRLVDDGRPHYVKIVRNGRNLRLIFDGEERQHTIGSADAHLDLGSYMFLGGVDHKDRLPWHVWSGDAAGNVIGEDRKYFRGCIWDLKLNGEESLDLESYMHEQAVTGIESDCRTMPEDCETDPCQNGPCHERWNGFKCDCSETSFTGKRCELQAPFVAFSGYEYLRINFHPTFRSHTNDISLRFKTQKPDGLLFGTQNRVTDDYMNAFLENGHVKLETNLGGTSRPTRLIVQCQHALNDDRWHTLHIKRRARYLEAHVDSCSKVSEDLPGVDYGLNIDDILVGKMGHDDSNENSFWGHMQNFYFDHYQFFDYFLYGNQPGDIRFGGNVNATFYEWLLAYHSMTFRAVSDSYIIMPGLQIVGDTSIRLLFRTGERDGLLLYNAGHGTDFLALELVNGILHFSANDGTGRVHVTSTAPLLSDNQWHLVEIVQTDPNKFSLTVDKKYSSMLLLPETRNTLDLTDSLYVGGIPDSLRHRVQGVITSKKNFAGCFASYMVNGRLYNPMTDAIRHSPYVTRGCTDITSNFCFHGACYHNGICVEAVNGYTCDCNMTSYVGRHCNEEAEGYRFGERFGSGITIYRFPERMVTSSDRLALGFMTWNPNGTLIRLDSDISADVIEAKLVNGYVVVSYDIGDGMRYLTETRQLFNDGRYHYLVFTRNGDNATLRVDDLPYIYHQSQGTGSVVFNGMSVAKIGGNLNEQQEIIDYFNGIISGVYINGYRVVDRDVYYHDIHITKREDVIIATHPFYVEKPYPTRPTWPPVPTDKPPVPPTDKPPVPPTDKPIVPPTDKPIVPPTDKPPVPITPGGKGPGGGGAGWEKGGGGLVLVEGEGPETAELVGGLGSVAGSDLSEGARAAAVAGGMLGILALASSALWAFYKFKPGLIGVGGGSSGMVISAPTATTPLIPPGGVGTGAAAGRGGAVVVQTGGSSGAGGASGAGGGSAFVIRSAGSGTGTGGAGSSAGVVSLSEHFQSISSSSTAGGGGGAGGAGAAAGGGSGTMNRGIQTEVAGGGGGGGGAHDQSMSRSVMIERNIQNVYNVNQDGGYGTGQQGMGTMGSQSGYGAGSQMMQQGYNTMTSSYGYDASQGISQDRMDGDWGAQQGGTMGSHAGMSNMYEIQNMALGYSGYSQQELYNQQRMMHQRLAAAASGAFGGPMPNLMAAEEIRVDCAKLTTNGRYVVTGSIYGPPQVWDLKTGDLVRVMKGEDFSSTDLHLANGDTLLVGQVAELEQINPTDPTAKYRLHHRKLQIWDFESGHPLDMRRNEVCTASCMMNDGERMLLGRTDKYGKNTMIIIWDILGNEPVRQITCDASVGFADYISYLNLSKDNRYVIAGFQNSHDNKANFITFDLSSSSATAVSPKVMALDAQVEVTAILENHEAVTGTRGGELIIWSIRTGRELRQLVTPSTGTMSRRDVFTQPAHNAEVKDVVLSKDGQLLVSASADRTLKMWNLEFEKLMHTLVGHSDEVWCCTISNDNELVVSGSRDCTIRLWRSDDGMPVAAIDAGMDIFRVMLSNNKKTIVALADKAASRKLIMLKVVRSKVKGASRATSPRLSDGVF